MRRSSVRSKRLAAGLELPDFEAPGAWSPVDLMSVMAWAECPTDTHQNTNRRAACARQAQAESCPAGPQSSEVARDGLRAGRPQLRLTPPGTYAARHDIGDLAHGVGEIGFLELVFGFETKQKAGNIGAMLPTGHESNLHRMCWTHQGDERPGFLGRCPLLTFAVRTVVDPQRPGPELFEGCDDGLVPLFVLW